MSLNTVTSKTFELLNRILWGSIIVVGVIAAGLGLRFALNVREANSLSSQSVSMERQLKQGLPTVDTTTKSVMPHGFATLGLLQAAVTQATEKYHCQLTEFKSGTTVAPYTPRYRKEAPDGSWSQLDAHFTVGGGLRDVIETLQALNDLSFPIEIDSIDLTRDKVLGDGSAHINVQVQLRAISEGAAT